MGIRRIELRVLLAVIALSVAFAMIPRPDNRVYAQTKKPDYLGPAQLGLEYNTSSAMVVYFGGKEWKVIGYDGNGIACEEGEIVLFVNEILTTCPYSWNSVEGASGYDVFFVKCKGKGKNYTVETVGSTTFRWTKTGLKKGTAYKAFVKAYVMENGSKTNVGTSPTIHAYAGSGTKKHTNAKNVKVNKSKVTLKKGRTFKIKAKIRKVKKSKKLMPKSHVRKLRYLTSSPEVATVSKKGKITAKGSGTCYIYVLAHNGVSKQVKVTVK